MRQSKGCKRFALIRALLAGRLTAIVIRLAPPDNSRFNCCELALEGSNKGFKRLLRNVGFKRFFLKNGKAVLLVVG